MERGTRYRNPELRELLLSGLRIAPVRRVRPEAHYLRRNAECRCAIPSRAFPSPAWLAKRYTSRSDAPPAYQDRSQILVRRDLRASPGP